MMPSKTISETDNNLLPETSSKSYVSRASSQSIDQSDILSDETLRGGTDSLREATKGKGVLELPVLRGMELFLINTRQHGMRNPL